MKTIQLTSPLAVSDSNFDSEISPCDNLAKISILLALGNKASELRLENVDGSFRFFRRTNNMLFELVPPPQHMIPEILAAFRRITGTDDSKNQNSCVLELGDGQCVLRARFLPTDSYDMVSLQFRRNSICPHSCDELLDSYLDARKRLSSDTEKVQPRFGWNIFGIFRTNNPLRVFLHHAFHRTRNQMLEFGWSERVSNVAIMFAFILVAYLTTPIVFEVPKHIWLPVAIVGILLFFFVPELKRQPENFLAIRTFGFLSIGAGIFAFMQILPVGILWLSIHVSRERSFTASTLLLSAGEIALFMYWFLNIWTSQSLATNKSIDRSGGVRQD